MGKYAPILRYPLLPRPNYMQTSFDSKIALRKLVTGWQRFILAPEIYWKSFLLVVLLLGILVLILDAYIFWKYALELENKTVTPNVVVETLEREKFEAALSTIAEKKKSFDASTGGVTVKNIFQQ